MEIKNKQSMDKANAPGRDFDIEAQKGNSGAFQVEVHKNEINLILMNLGSREKTFFEKLMVEGNLGKIAEISAYHTSPSCNRESIQKDGLRNRGVLLTQKQREFFLEFTKKVPYLKSLAGFVLGEEGNGNKRGIYVSFDNPLHDCYRIPESIRLFFSYISENFGVLNKEEQELVAAWFKDFHVKFSQGTDVWRIRAIENQEVLKIILPPIMDYYEYFPEDFKDTKNFEIGDNVHFPNGIGPNGFYLQETKIYSPGEMWTGRCENLLRKISLN